jgi:hypothetical protein
MSTKKVADILAVLSVVAVLAAAYVNVADLKEGLFKLAGTQWILIGIVLGIYALYLRTRD